MHYGLYEPPTNISDSILRHIGFSKQTNNIWELPIQNPLCVKTEHIFMEKCYILQLYNEKWNIYLLPNMDWDLPKFDLQEMLQLRLFAGHLQ